MRTTAVAQTSTRGSAYWSSGNRLVKLKLGPIGGEVRRRTIAIRRGQGPLIIAPGGSWVNRTDHAARSPGTFSFLAQAKNTIVKNPSMKVDTPIHMIKPASC